MQDRQRIVLGIGFLASLITVFTFVTGIMSISDLVDLRVAPPDPPDVEQQVVCEKPTDDQFGELTLAPSSNYSFVLNRYLQGSSADLDFDGYILTALALQELGALDLTQLPTYMPRRTVVIGDLFDWKLRRTSAKVRVGHSYGFLVDKQGPCVYFQVTDYLLGDFAGDNRVTLRYKIAELSESDS